MKRKKALAPQIRTLSANGLSAQQIAGKLGCKISYVRTQISYARNPGYKARWMAMKRARDPDYYARELAWQCAQYRKKRALDRETAE